MRRIGLTLPRRAPLPLFVAALMLAAFAGGLYVARYKVFPYALLSSARKTFVTAVETNLRDPDRDRWEFVDVPPDQAADRRFEFMGSDHLTDPILVPGGVGRFREYCPDHVGCLAVEYAGRGEVRHAYPYRPDELEERLEKEDEFTADFPYEHAPGFSFLEHARIRGVSKYANGDLLVVFSFRHTHPYPGGVARIDGTGKPVWYRPDYSHHRPRLTDGEMALVPGMRLDGPIHDIPKLPGRGVLRMTRLEINLDCEELKHDMVRVIDPAGRVRESIPVLDAIIESGRGSVLWWVNPCNPTHLNAVDELGEDVSVAGLEPGDLVVSLRNVHAFAVLDRDTHRLKRVVRGGFMMQHSVLHFEGSRFLMMDNVGGMDAEGRRKVSRLLMVDAASGEETTVFPNHRTPGHLRGLHTWQEGGVSISPDRSRAMVTFTQEGKAVEVRIADGAVLVVFDFLHDVSHLEEFPEERATRAVRQRLTEIRYIDEG